MNEKPFGSEFLESMATASQAEYGSVGGDCSCNTSYMDAGGGMQQVDAGCDFCPPSDE
jgi:hypothetical protein